VATGAAIALHYYGQRLDRGEAPGGGGLPPGLPPPPSEAPTYGTGTGEPGFAREQELLAGPPRRELLAGPTRRDRLTYDQAVHERNVRLRTLATGEIVGVRPLGGGYASGGAYVLSLEGGMQGVLKLGSREHDVCRGIPHQTMFTREICASELADVLGFSQFLPATTVRRDFLGGREGDGSIQEYYEDAVPANRVQEELIEQAAERLRQEEGELEDPLAEVRRTLLEVGDTICGTPEECARCAVWDYVLCSLDRSSDNWMLLNGHPLLVDNGMSMPHTYYPDEMRRFVYPWGFLHQSIFREYTVPDLSRWRSLWPEARDTLARNGLGEDTIGLFEQRFHWLIRGSGRRIGELPFPPRPELTLEDAILQGETGAP
jgi:Phosphatidylinositol 3- and 4-kinase